MRMIAGAILVLAGVEAFGFGSLTTGGAEMYGVGIPVFLVGVGVFLWAWWSEMKKPRGSSRGNG